MWHRRLALETEVLAGPVASEGHTSQLPLQLFLFKKIFIYLAVLSSSCGMWDLQSSLQHARS